MDATDNEIARDKRRQQDLDDLNNEMSGAETGRIKRFLPNDVNTPEGKRKKEAREAFESQLMRLLQDPVYRAKYEETMSALEQAEQKTDAALVRIEQSIRTGKQNLTDMEDRAARLPDGTLVFRDAAGTVRTADGEAVEDHLAETILWTGNEPDFEAYQAQTQKVDALDNTHREVKDYRENVLGAARDRMSDEDDPPSMDEMDDIIEGISEKMPYGVNEFGSTADITQSPEINSSQFKIPDLSGNP